MKARRVKGVDANASLAKGGRRIVHARLDDLHSFLPAVRDPANVQELHDMRIAAKRLRYALELTAPAFGPEARKAARTTKRLQEVLGDIHDCDEMLPRVSDHIDRLRAEDAAAVREAAPFGAPDIGPALARAAPNRDCYQGLEALAAYLRARREVLYARFIDEWSRLELQGFRKRLERALEEPARPAEAVPEPPAAQPQEAPVRLDLARRRARGAVG
jgi:hypothetical protein